MSIRRTLKRRNLFRDSLPTAVLALLLAACGGGGGSDDGAATVTPTPTPTTLAEAPPETALTVVGTIDTAAAQAQAVAPGTSLTLDDGSAAIPLDPQGRFEIHNVQDDAPCSVLPELPWACRCWSA
jgi:hypothetical protein